MRVAFWGMERECGTTSNLMALASYMACNSNLRVAMLQLEKEKQELKDYFSIKETELVKEKNDYFALEGMDYLFSVGKSGNLTGELVLENVESLIEDRLFCVPTGSRRLYQFYPKETNEIMQQVIELLGEHMDVTLIDCGNRTDEWTRQVIREADLLVVNLRQTSASFDEFFIKYANLASKVIYLVGNYQKDSVYNKQNLRRIYRIPKNRLAVVPFNQEFWQACEKGRLDKYMKGKRSLYATEKRQYFMRELDAAMQILVKMIDGSKE